MLRFKSYCPTTAPKCTIPNFYSYFRGGVCPYVVKGPCWASCLDIGDHGCALAVAFMLFCMCHGSAGWPPRRPGQILVGPLWMVRWGSSDIGFF